MNSPVGGTRTSEARMSHRIGGKRTKLGRAATKGDRDRAPRPGPPALKILATREDPNPVKAGAAVPVKLSLGGDFGLDILGRGIARYAGHRL
jgi:hypothetical protein